MYEIRITHAEQDVRDNVKTKRDAVAFIARELGLNDRAKRSIASEITAKADSTIYRDNFGYRIYVWYTS